MNTTRAIAKAAVLFSAGMTAAAAAGGDVQAGTTATFLDVAKTWGIFAALAVACVAVGAIVLWKMVDYIIGSLSEKLESCVDALVVNAAAFRRLDSAFQRMVTNCPYVEKPDEPELVAPDPDDPEVAKAIERINRRKARKGKAETEKL